MGITATSIRRKPSSNQVRWRPWALAVEQCGPQAGPRPEPAGAGGRGRFARFTDGAVERAFAGREVRAEVVRLHNGARIAFGRSAPKDRWLPYDPSSRPGVFTRAQVRDLLSSEEVE